MTLHDRLIHGLDRAAERTGIPNLVGSSPERRPSRWLPIFVLAMGFGGFGYVLWRPGSGYGLAAISLAYAFGSPLPLLGPVKPWRSAEIADEFDRSVRSRAYLAGLSVTACTGWLGLWLVVALALLGNWSRETMIAALSALGFLMPVIWAAVPTLQASWAIRPLADDS